MRERERCFKKKSLSKGKVQIFKGLHEQAGKNGEKIKGSRQKVNGYVFVSFANHYHINRGNERNRKIGSKG